MAVRTRLIQEREWIPEQTTLAYRARLVDEQGLFLTSASLFGLTLSLYALALSLPILNDVEGINILNMDRGSFDANGYLVVTLRPADNVLFESGRREEHHVMLIQWTYANGEKAGAHEVEFVVKNLGRV